MWDSVRCVYSKGRGLTEKSIRGRKWQTKDALSLVEREREVSISLLDFVMVILIMLSLNYDTKVTKIRMTFVVYSVVFSAINKKQQTTSMSIRQSFGRLRTYPLRGPLGGGLLATFARAHALTHAHARYFKKAAIRASQGWLHL